MTRPGVPTNQLLSSLSPTDLAVLQPHLKSIELPQDTILFEIGDPIDQVYFPYSGVVSLVVPLASGDMIECAMIGRESVVGGSSALGGPISLCKAIAQIGGTGSVIAAKWLRGLADRSPDCRTALLRHEQLVLVQAQQSAACNAAHSVEARLSRWLLRSRDLQNSDDLPLTQEFLGQMLGVRRTSVSVVANTLQGAGLIRYRRGHIRILDLEGLQKTACECYETVRSFSERLLSYPTHS